ncbi:MAG: HTTM domain-containing protein [Halobacteriaceae archaeon]
MRIHWRHLWMWVKNKFANRVQIDTRGLAAMRIGVGILILIDISIRLQDLRAFYTNSGVLPRSLLIEEYPLISQFSIHTLIGDIWFQIFLFGILAISTVFLLLGYYTKPATVVTLLLVISLHARNPLILNAGDAILRRLLFWSLFLPIGATWSINRHTEHRSDKQIITVATFAYLIQIVLIYIVNLLFKLRGDAWTKGNAVQYVFELDQLTILFGDLLSTYPSLLDILGTVWMSLLLFAPLLILLTGYRRTVLVGLFMSMHFGMFLTLQLGLFPLISIVALLPFLPKRFWERVEAELSHILSLTNQIERMASVFNFRHPNTLTEESLSRGFRLVKSGVIMAIIILMIIWNGITLGYMGAPDSIESQLKTAEYRWDMFAPNPRKSEGWFVIRGELQTGETVDPFYTTLISWDRPPDLATTYPSHRWLLYLLEIQRPSNSEFRSGFVNYLCRNYNENHVSTLESVTIFYIEEQSQLHQPDTRTRRNLGTFSCAGGSMPDR